MECLFVYGTLLKSFDHEVIRSVGHHLQLNGPGTLMGRLYDLGDYPGYVEAADGYLIQGEVYQVKEPQKVFNVLDEYEGEEYVRKRLIVQLNGSEDIRCWVYVYQDTLPPQCKEIINGDYIAFVSNKNNG
jgi:gamma-glutamylcyclotransferase (GGCT)/AIG2-like uncharacterized protein YtfP